MDLLLLEQLKSLIAGEEHLIPNLANASALLYHALPDINWAGFYLTIEDYLLLGPFQGLPACIRIPFGKGVCGTAALENRTIRVENVHAFLGHIACDAGSNSEIVLPIRKGSAVAAVLDIDSPLFGRFTEEDQDFLEKFVSIIEQYCFPITVPF